MPRILISAVLFAVAITAGCLANDEISTLSLTREQAAVIAKKAFIDATANHIPQFTLSDSSIKDDNEWRFIIQGSGEFARPGYHAIVVISKRTGKAKVIKGE